MRSKLSCLVLLLAMSCVVANRSGAAGLPDVPGGRLLLACQNGHDYPIRARAVSDEGELVTGTIHTGRHHAVPLRLIPMGVGYRYAGPGIWVDGLGAEVVLNIGRNFAVPCSVLSE